MFRSNKHIVAQVIDDRAGRTLAAASTIEADLRGGATGNKDAATKVGTLVAERAKAAGVTRSSSTAAASSTTGASPPWPTPPAKPDWSSRWQLTSGQRGRPNPREPAGDARCASRASSTSTGWPRSSRAAGGSRSPRSWSIGDGNGRVGLGYGKAKEVPLAIQKGTEEATKNLFEVPLAGSHDHPPDHRRDRAPAACCCKPAAPGTGVIAGGAARAILEEAGIHDVLCKSLGSSNHINVARATIAGLKAPEAARRDRPPAAACDAEEFVPKGLLEAYKRAQARPAHVPDRGGVMAELKVTQVRSAIGTKPKHRGTLRALGLGRIGKTNTLPDRPEIRGMIARVPHLVTVEESRAR